VPQLELDAIFASDANETDECEVDGEKRQQALALQTNGKFGIERDLY
jgi:hypothetical protein